MKKETFKSKNHKCQINIPISTIQVIREKANQSELTVSKLIYSELTKVYPDKTIERSKENGRN